jgi:hypothetical protein
MDRNLLLLCVRKVLLSLLLLCAFVARKGYWRQLSSVQSGKIQVVQAAVLEVSPLLPSRWMLRLHPEKFPLNSLRLYVKW